MIDPTNLDPDSRSVPTRPLCKMCQRRVTIDIQVDSNLWRSVIGPCDGSGYVCADCFTREADERMIDWTDFVTFIPCSMARQVKIQEQAAREAGTIRCARSATQFCQRNCEEGMCAEAIQQNTQALDAVKGGGK